jgi:hypothetical protein
MNININRGTWSGDCTDEADLILNQIKYPAIRKMLEYKDQRMISTLLVNGAVGPYGIKDVPSSKLEKLDEGKKIADNAYRFNIMGRIQRPSTIISQQGASGTDGSFQLVMADNYLVPGMNAVFYGGRYTARVMGYPTGTQGNYLYNFQSPNGEVFNFATMVSPQPGVKTCFGSYTSYGEASLKGYGRSQFPDTYINHTTIQRKTVSITGTALSDVLWYEVESENGPVKGWMYEQLQQARAQFIMEREYQRWFGVSTMKGDNGELLTQSRLFDPVSNTFVIAGDGWEEQVKGGNEIFGSGTNGEATEDDFSDMMKAMRKKSDMVSGLTYVYVTGEDGFSNAQKKMAALNVNQNIQMFRNVADMENKPGGATPPAGVTFCNFNIDGDTVWFIKHPMFDDDQRFPERGNDGKLLMSSNYFCMTVGEGAGKNMDVFAKGGKNGVDRSFVNQEFNGMTGSQGQIMSEEDAKKYAMLTEDLLVIYNTNKCGIIYKSA